MIIHLSFSPIHRRYDSSIPVDGNEESIVIITKFRLSAPTAKELPLTYVLPVIFSVRKLAYMTDIFWIIHELTEWKAGMKAFSICQKKIKHHWDEDTTLTGPH